MTPEQLDDIERRATARSALDDREQEVLALVAEVRRLREVLRGLVPLPTSDDTTFTQQAEYGSDAR